MVMETFGRHGPEAEKVAGDGSGSHGEGETSATRVARPDAASALVCDAVRVPDERGVPARQHPDCLFFASTVLVT